MSAPGDVGSEHPRTRSRKRAEEALRSAEESAQKRAKEEREKQEKAVKLGQGGMAKAGKLDYKPSKRKANAINHCGPVRKLTTQLLSTYNAINQLFHLRKKSGLRKCALWGLLQTLDMYRERLHHGNVTQEELPDVMGRMKQAVNMWLFNHNHQHFGVELAYFQHLAPHLNVSESNPGSIHSLDKAVSIAYYAVDRFYVAVEKLKMARHTFEDVQGNYVCEVGESVGLHGRYVVEGLLGGGAFCKAWAARDRATGQRVCMKVACNRKHCFEQSRREVKTLRYLNEQCGAKAQNSGVVKLRDAFVFREHQVLVFDQLAYDLYELLKHEKFCGVSLKLVRKYAVQILQTLACLSQSTGLGLIHCDLKPENIMVVNRNQTRVHVIDFGSSCFVGEQGSTYIQSRFYRSPEVLLGCPYGTQIDVWSFGCVLFEMYTGQPLFNGKDPEDQLLKIVDLLGKPPESMRAQQQFFLPGTKEGDRIAAQQTTRSFADRFRAIGYACITRRKRADGVALVDDVKTDSSGRVTDESLLQFLDLVTKCLDLDPSTRIQPMDALRHAFCQSLLQQTPPKEGQASPRPTPSSTTEEEEMCQSKSAPAASMTASMQVDVDNSKNNQETMGESATTGLEGSVSELEVVNGKNTRSSTRGRQRRKSH